MDTEFRALFIEEGLVDPLSTGVEYLDERAKAIMDAIWEADGEMFIRVLSELFGLDQEGRTDDRHRAMLERVKDSRDERVQERDRVAGINITEAEILEKVDLDDLDLDDTDEE